MASGSGSRDADAHLEGQNDQRLDELHAKIRTLRGVTTDIYDDVERQNLTLDDTTSTFTSFTTSLSTSSQRLSRTFGLHGVSGGVRQSRIILYTAGALLGLWILYRLVSWYLSSSSSARQ